MRKVLIVCVLFLLSGTLCGFIEKLFPLKDIVDQSTHILIGRLSSVDADRKTVVVEVDRALKGEKEFRRVLMNLGAGPDVHARYLLAHLKQGIPAVIYYKREGNSLASCVHAGDTWFQLFATDEPDHDKVWWRMSHIEVYLGRTYNGRTQKLLKLTEDIIAGRSEGPKPDPTVPKLNPAARKQAPQRSRPSRPEASTVPTDGMEAISGWMVDDSWCRPARLTVLQNKERGKELQAKCNGKTDKKLALVIRHHMDISSETWFAADVTNDSDGPIQVSVAFGAAPDFSMHESPSVAVESGRRHQPVRFRINGADFKCRESNWKHTRGLPNNGRVDKVMLLVSGLPERGGVSFDHLRVSRAGFVRHQEFPHKGGEVRGIAWADINSDDMLDACLCVRHGNLLLINEGNGSFRERGADWGLTEGSRTASFADYNGDGHIDLVTNNFHLYANSGGKLRRQEALLSEPSRRNPEGAGFIDFNGDGLPDILITNGQYGIQLYRNTGAGAGWLRDVSNKAGLGRDGIGVGNGDFTCFTDVDGDGLTDFFYNLKDGVLALNVDGKRFRAENHSGLSLPGGAKHKRGVSFADYDRDNDMDCLVPGPDGCRLYRNNNDGTFSDVTTQAGDLSRARGPSFAAAWGDVNNDGRLDLVVCNTSGTSRLYVQTEEETFKDVTSEIGLSGIGPAFSSSLADCDNDGDLDLLVNTSDRAVLYLNEMQRDPAQGVLKVRLAVTKGLVGAVIRVADATGRPLGMTELSGATSCGGQPSPIAHFAVPRQRCKVSVVLSDARLAQRTVEVNQPVTSLVLKGKDFQ